MLAPIDTATLATSFWSASSSVAYGAAAPYALLHGADLDPGDDPAGPASGREQRTREDCGDEQPADRRRDQVVRPGRGRRRRPAARPAGLDHRGARPVRLRQDHPAAAGRRLPRARRRAPSASATGSSPAAGDRSRRRSAGSGTCPRRAPSSRTSTSAANIGFGLSRTRPPVRSGRRDARPGRADQRRTPGATRTSSPAASSSGSHSPGHSRRSPTVVLLDEPFSSLDASLRASTGRAVVRALRAAEATAVLVTHDQDEALSLADQVAVMRAGRLVQAATPLDLYRSPVDPDVARFVGGATILPATVRDGVATCVLGDLRVGGRLPGRGRRRSWSAPSRSGSTVRTTGTTKARVAGGELLRPRRRRPARAAARRPGTGRPDPGPRRAGRGGDCRGRSEWSGHSFRVDRPSPFLR